MESRYKTKQQLCDYLPAYHYAIENQVYKYDYSNARFQSRRVNCGVIFHPSPQDKSYVL